MYFFCDFKRITIAKVIKKCEFDCLNSHFEMFWNNIEIPEFSSLISIEV